MAKTILAWVVLVFCAVLYLYALFAAIGNLTGMLGLGAQLGTSLSVAGWAWLLAGVLMPIAVAVLAVLVGRGRGIWVRILLLATGVAVIAVLQIDLMHAIPQTSYFASF